jgi:hypothetical protein
MARAVSDVRIRFATADDASLLLQLIWELAAYERAPNAVVATEDDLRLWLRTRAAIRGVARLSRRQARRSCLVSSQVLYLARPTRGVSRRSVCHPSGAPKGGRRAADDPACCWLRYGAMRLRSAALPPRICTSGIDPSRLPPTRRDQRLIVRLSATRRRSRFVMPSLRPFAATSVGQFLTVRMVRQILWRSERGSDRWVSWRRSRARAFKRKPSSLSRGDRGFEFLSPPAKRWYGAGGEEMAPSSLANN